MKTIPIALLRSHPDGNLWHRAWAEGVSRNGVDLEVSDDFPLTAPVYVPRLAGAIALAVPQEKVAERERVCGACEWNRNWICEHMGCLPCKQREAGGLKEAIKIDTFRCPAGKVA